MIERQITLFIIDDDPIFRLGLTTALTAIEDLQILTQGDTQQLRQRLNEQIPDVILLEPASKGWQLAQKLKRNYPQVRICLISQTLSLQELLAAQKSGIEGYFPKGKTIDDLVILLRQIVSGTPQWQYLSSLTDSPSQNPLAKRKRLNRLFQSGMAQIEDSLSLVNSQLNKPELSGLDWLFWTGRRRELLASRWLVSQLMPQKTIIVSEQPQQIAANNSSLNNALVPRIQPPNLLTVSPSNPLTISTLLEKIFTKIQFGLENATNVPLEIDILEPQKRSELLYLVYSQIRQIINEFPLLEITPEKLQERLSLILFKIWEESTRLFIDIYYPNKEKLLDGLLEDIIELESESVQKTILNKIPFVYELWAYLLWEENGLGETIDYRTNYGETISRAEILLENLLIQEANGVIASILNNFFDNAIFKRELYKRGMKSSREIARFRNQLSWKYQKEKYWKEPKAIFESQYPLFFFKGGKISQIAIESSRQQELNKLTGIPWVVTIVLETRDASAPGVRAVVALIGQGLVYVLSQVIGRGIGLIGRGIIQGIGNTLDQVRYGKNSQQSK